MAPGDAFAAFHQEHTETPPPPTTLFPFHGTVPLASAHLRSCRVSHRRAPGLLTSWRDAASRLTRPQPAPGPSAAARRACPPRGPRGPRLPRRTSAWPPAAGRRCRGRRCRGRHGRTPSGWDVSLQDFFFAPVALTELIHPRGHRPTETAGPNHGIQKNVTNILHPSPKSSRVNEDS